MNDNITVILPCAGKSSRFPNVRPKWMMTHQNSNPMVVEAANSIDGANREFVVTILREHEEEYEATAGLIDAFYAAGLPEPRICVLENETSCQAETVYRTIRQLGITGKLLIKDCDNGFCFQIPDTPNYVCAASLEDFDQINARSKSYIQTNDDGIILSIREKEIVSTKFAVGGYGFESADLFVRTYESLKHHFKNKEMYISHVIDSLIQNDILFFEAKVKNYEDWGTLEDWKRNILRKKNYIVDIDGVLIKNCGKYFKPRYNMDVECIQKNVDLINRLYDEGNRIILMTARDSALRSFTEEQLKKHDIKYHDLLMDSLHSCRVVINDFSHTNPHPSAIALSIPRNFDRLEELV